MLRSGRRAIRLRGSNESMGAPHRNVLRQRPGNLETPLTTTVSHRVRDGSTASASSPAEPAAPPVAQRRMRFLVYDACRVGNRACVDEPLRERLMAVRRDVVGPRYKLAAAEPAAFDGEPFTVEDYAAPCPSWALLGAAEDGFDPSDTRMYKKKANGKSR